MKALIAVLLIFTAEAWAIADTRVDKQFNHYIEQCDQIAHETNRIYDYVLRSTYMKDCLYESNIWILSAQRDILEASKYQYSKQRLVDPFDFDSRIRALRLEIESMENGRIYAPFEKLSKLKNDMRFHLGVYYRAVDQLASIRRSFSRN